MPEKAAAAPPSFTMVADGVPNCVAAAVRTPGVASVVQAGLEIDGVVVQAFCAGTMDQVKVLAAVDSSSQVYPALGATVTV